MFKNRLWLVVPVALAVLLSPLWLAQLVGASWTEALAQEAASESQEPSEEKKSPHVVVIRGHAGHDRHHGHDGHQGDGDGHSFHFGASSRGFLGVHLTGMTPELRHHLGAPEDTGVLIAKVEPESPAQKAGIKVGDIVTAVDGEAVRSPHHLQRKISPRGEGDAVTLELYRDGKLEQLTVTLAERQSHVPHLHLEGLKHLEGLGDRIREALEGAELENLGEHIGGVLEGIDWDQIRHRSDAAGDLQWEELGETLRSAMEGIDWQQIGPHLEHSLEGIQWDEMGVHLEKALEGVEWEGLSERIHKALEALGAAEDIDVRIEAEEADEEPRRGGRTL